MSCTPRAIVMVSAHWLGPAFSVASGARPQLIYDYYGFPPHTYKLKYPAPGAPQLAARIAGLLGQAQSLFSTSIPGPESVLAAGVSRRWRPGRPGE